MGINFNIITDEVGAENYLALYLSIKGYIDKETGEKIFPSAKESLLLMNIPTNDKKEGLQGE